MALVFKDRKVLFRFIDSIQSRSFNINKKEGCFYIKLDELPFNFEAPEIQVFRFNFAYILIQKHIVIDLYDGWV